MKCGLAVILCTAIPFCVSAADNGRYPVSLTVLSAKLQSNGIVKVHHGRPSFCNNPEPGFQAGFCTTYNPPDTITEQSTLIVTAALDSKLYTLSCGRCGMLEPGQYAARGSRNEMILRTHRIDKYGNREKQWRETKLRIIGEETQAPGN